MGREPQWAMTSLAASEPSLPASSSVRPRARPSRKPAAYWSPAPVVSITLSTGKAETSTRSAPRITTEPSAPRVTAAISTMAASLAAASSKSSVSNRAPSSASLARTISADCSMKLRSSARQRATTKVSDRVMATLRPALCAAAAARSKAARAGAGANR